MSLPRIPISRTYDERILDAAWDLRDEFVALIESEPEETSGFYLRARNEGDQLSPGNYEIVEWSKVEGRRVETDMPLDRWIGGLCTYSSVEVVRQNPNQLSSALIDICLAQDRLAETING